MVNSINTTSSANSVEYATQGNDALDKDAFLQLMIAQLQNQDPLEPLDGTDYSAQLAQFSSLEQMKNINDTLNMSLDANYLLTQSINNTMTAALIGKEVKIAGDTVSFEGQDKTIIGYELSAPAQDIKINIVNSSGQTIKTFDNLDKAVGQYKLNWDFTDNNGNAVSAGDYRVEVEAKTLGLDDMEVAQYFVGVINGVRYSANGTSLVVNDLEYEISDVFEVVEADDSSEEIISEESSDQKPEDDETS